MQSTQRRSRNSTRDREKTEILALRRLVGELEAHLLAKAAACTSPQDGVTHCRSHGSITQSRMWQRVAERQMQSKCVSERRNRELLAHVQRNADWIERLWGLLRETRAVRARSTSTSMLIDELRHGTKWSEAVMLEQLKRQVRAVSWHTLQQQLVTEAQARGVSSVFGGCDDAGGIDSVGSGIEPTQTHIQKEGQRTDATDIAHGRGLVRVACVRQLPFDVFATSSAVWAALTAMSSASATISSSTHDAFSATTSYPNTSGLHVMERSHDACVLKYRLSVPSRDSAAATSTIECLAVVQVVRGDDECGTKLFVWRSASSIECCSSDGTAVGSSHRSSETMWLTVTVSPRSFMSSTVTIVAQSQVESSSIAIASASDSSSTVDMRMQEVIAAAVEQCVDAVVLSAENALVDSELARRGARLDAVDDSVWV